MHGINLIKLGLKTRLKNPYDAYWDFKLGVNTFGFSPAIGKPSDPDFQVHYMPTPYRKALHILKALGVSQEDVFADVGCGLGRVVFCASWLGAKKAIGIDINEALISCAQETHHGSKLQSRDIEFLAQPAQETDFDEITTLYMFHPFGAGTMQKVMEVLGESLKIAPRNFRLAYENPVNAAVVDAVDRLTRTGEWEVNPGQGSSYPVTFWSSQPKT